LYTRREIGKLALASLPAASVAACMSPASAQSRSTARFGGLSVGIIAPYSFRMLGTLDADALLKNMTQLGLSAAELQSPPVEAYAGAPLPPPRPVPFGQPLNAEQQEAQRAGRERLRQWRQKAPAAAMEKYRELRKQYEDAGVSIELIKFEDLTANWPNAEIDYAFTVARTLGCRGITCEPPLSHTRKLAEFAEKHRLMLGYHGHTAVADMEAFARPGSWEQAFFHSRYNGANIDIGHFTAGNSTSPLPFIRQYHERITNLHLKDRRINNGPNVPWGQGDTPIRDILQLMKREKYTFMATTELEYPIPAGSDVMSELQKCVRFVEDALAST
jgi:sugar phosphate isomerase/epimerase